MQLRTILIFSILIFSSLAGCVEDVREEQKVEKNEDLRKLDDTIITTNNDTTTIAGLENNGDIIIPNNSIPVREIDTSNMTQEECEREGGVWVEVLEDRSGNTSYAMSTIRKIGGIIDNNSIDDYDNDNSSGLNWDEFVEIWNFVEGDNLTNDSQIYRDLFSSFYDVDFDSDGELSITELLRAQDEITMNTRPSWCSFRDIIVEVTQELCEERGGTWTEAPDREDQSYCEFEEEEREESERNMTQEDCERRGGTWTEAPDREGQSYCEFEEEEREESERNMTQEDCEERGGTWTEAPDREGEFYCDFDDEEDREEEETSENTPQEDCEESGGTWIEDRRECQLESAEDESDS
ncbi:MAG: hypothetical protein CMB48_01305 [Euryarchaeota archaeon]|nr:hypothetical protein [Euryarchaeota archaeon]